MGDQGKNWCFTINNPTVELDDLADVGQITYAVWQLEEGAMGTPHYQGYLMLSVRLRRTQVLAFFVDHPHLEVAKGTPKDNRAYCTKSDGRIGEFNEIGEFPEKSQGRRTDLDEVHSALKDGLDAATYSDRFFDLFVKYPKLVDNYAIAQVRSRDPSTSAECHLLLGPPGHGKTTFGRRLASIELDRVGGPGIFYKQPGPWWDGYRGQRVVILDDFGGASLSFTHFKHMVDVLPIPVEVKGAFCNMAATVFIITSNYDPKEWWDPQVTKGAEKSIFRRINSVRYFEEFGKFRHYSSYAAYVHDYGTPRKENDPFVISTPLCTAEEALETLAQAQAGL